MKKKVLSVFLAGVMAVSMLAGCGSDKKETKSADGTAKTAGYAKDAKLKVWGSQEDQDMLKGIIEDFKADNPEAADWSIETAVVSAAEYDSRCICLVISSNLLLTRSQSYSLPEHFTGSRKIKIKLSQTMWKTLWRMLRNHVETCPNARNRPSGKSGKMIVENCSKLRRSEIMSTAIKNFL